MGGKGGYQNFVGGGGGGLEDGIAMSFVPITFVVHNQKSNGGGGGQWAAHGVNGGMPPKAPHVTPLVLFPIVLILNLKKTTTYIYIYKIIIIIIIIINDK